MISYDKKFIFLHLGKCGGSSVKRELKIACRKYKFDVDHFRGHNELQYYLDLIVGKNFNPDDFFKFTIVRNPWDRAVSWYYHWHMVYRPGSKKEPFKKWLKSKGNLNFVGLDQMDYVIKLEEIKKGISHVFHELGIPGMPVGCCITHNTDRPKKDYKEYYDAETKTHIRHKSRHDKKI